MKFKLFAIAVAVILLLVVSGAPSQTTVATMEERYRVAQTDSQTVTTSWTELYDDGDNWEWVEIYSTTAFRYSVGSDTSSHEIWVSASTWYPIHTNHDQAYARTESGSAVVRVNKFRRRTN